jgi:hypothetical protein
MSTDFLNARIARERSGDQVDEHSGEPPEPRLLRPLNRFGVHLHRICWHRCRIGSVFNITAMGFQREVIRYGFSMLRCGVPKPEAVDKQGVLETLPTRRAHQRGSRRLAGAQ